jgi:IS1 family transposase
MELYKKKEENITEEDSADCGDCYTLTAMEANTRLFISHHEGSRTTEDATELFEDIERKRNPDSQIPLFISDDWDAFEEGLLNVYGKVEQPPYAGIGRKPKPVLAPKEGLLYAQVCKKREHGSVVGMVKRIVFGDPHDILSILGADTDGKINTSYIERLNLTIRNSLARFIRKTMNFSKNRTKHTKIIDFLQAWYNFVKPHISLRVPKIDGNRKWEQRTPMMAKGLTDHIWKLGELLMFRVPVQ